MLSHLIQLVFVKSLFLSKLTLLPDLIFKFETIVINRILNILKTLFRAQLLSIYSFLDSEAVYGL